MNDESQRQKDLDLSADSEVLGEALFTAAARVTRSRERRDKWRALSALEAQTMHRLEEYLEASSQTGSPGAAAKLRGGAIGLVFGLLPWRTAMKALADGTSGYLAAFKRLESSAETDLDRTFFAYLVAHEVAILAFAEAELDGPASDSLAPVQALLGRPE